MKAEHKDQYTRLGLKISYYRKLAGLTQEQLADRLDMNAAFIGHIEAPNIDKAISLDTLFDIAEILHVSPYRFLKFDD